MAEPIQFAEGSSDADLARALRRLPLFPLPGVVLFPHSLLQLHIFEERYRAMTRDVLAGARFFVVSLIAPGERETADKPAVQRIAGVGEIMRSHELPDGRFNLVLHGRARVRIDDELPQDRLYREVSATVLPDLPVPDADELRDSEHRCAPSWASSPTRSPRAASSSARSSPRKRRPPSSSTCSRRS